MTRVVLVPIGKGADDRGMIQNAIDGVGDLGGGVVHLTSGKYYLGPSDGAIPPVGDFSLKLGNNIHLSLDLNVILVRRYKARGAADATIRNKDFNGNSNIRITGGALTIENVANEGMQICFVKTSYLSIDNVSIRGVSKDYNIFLVDCTDVTVSNVVIDSGDEVVEDGLHIAGGARIAITNCQISSGDDAIALVHTVDHQTTAMTDVVISNCTLWSRAANAIKIEIVGAADEPIRRVSISNIVAKCGTSASSPAGGGILIVGMFDVELLSDIEIDGVLLDANFNNGSGLAIFGAHRVRLQRVAIRGTRLQGTINGSNNVALLDCIIDNPREPNVALALLVAESHTCQDVVVIGGRYANAKVHGIQIGGSARVERFQISNVYVKGSPNEGILIYNGVYGLISSNRVTDCANYGIREFSPSDNNFYVANLLKGNGTGGIQTPLPGTNSAQTANHS